ncbi:MAG TPA: putative metal-binding motif-containing protein [Polyangiaceae bacterium]|jgi:hypothetical protein
MNLSRTVSVAFVGLAIAACSSSAPDPGFNDPSSSGSSGSSSGGSTSSGGSGSSGGGSGSSSGTVGSFGDDSGPPPSMGTGCQYDDATDHDGDGFSGQDGDCNDCDPNTNPGAFDVPKDGIDEDCDGTPDNEPTGCDTNAVLDSTDPFNAALAIDLCRKTTETATGAQRTWGVVDASFIAPDGSDTCTGGGTCTTNANYTLGHGNLTKLGVNAPQNGGTHMLSLSSGTGRDPTDPGYQSVSGFDKGYTVGAAPGFPAPAPACPGVTTGQPHDGAALRVVIRVPTNAQSFTFNTNFFSYEFPNYICSEYNDTFVVEMAPAPKGASTGGNIAFDQAGNPISVNNALLQACTPQTAGGKMFPCPLGASSLASTGFAGHAATGWLQTQVNVDPSLKGQDITIVFAVWDSGDGILDSTALVDNFVWSTQPGQNTPVTVPTPPAQ